MPTKTYWISAVGLVLATMPLFVAATMAPALAEGPSSFKVWLADFREEARGQGISRETLNKALTDLKPIPRVIELDRNQPEFKLSLEQYLNRVVPEEQIARGREKLDEHGALLADVSRRYGVRESLLLALWGIETRYGRITGAYPVVDAIATLAYDGRRSSFFRKELIHALQILEAGHISSRKMKGSWAGAMGQIQFMPSSFLHFAVDYDGDGRIDIWHNMGDAFASAATYLTKSGWVTGQHWGREVRLPDSFDPTLLGLKNRKPSSVWRAMGVGPVGGETGSAKQDLSASVVAPDGPKGRTFLVHDNYRVILRWNRSHFFAVAVGTLADRIAEP
jgi:membrane-bound lytic murein transglycosylase B